MKNWLHAMDLNVVQVQKKDVIINRLHMLFNGIAIVAAFYYRVGSLSRRHHQSFFITAESVLIVAEVSLAFLWLLHQSCRWRPVKRLVFPERLPEEELPAIDVLICTADPTKEPSLGVMNTVISAMALDYPPHKLAVYLSDDGGCEVTLNAVREAWKFARMWLPFCRKYGLKTRCPDAYFSADEEESADKFIGRSKFVDEKKAIQKKYDEFQKALDDNNSGNVTVSRDHAPIIEVMRDETTDCSETMPLLAYVSREKRPYHAHHFKAGALNVLVRVSAVMSNAPYFLVLDCDMYCYDPSSARQAMCFYLDPKISPRLGWVQFPQKFRDISQHDIYCGRLNFIWRAAHGRDGLRGPNSYGCNFFMRREAIYGTDKIRKDIDLNQRKKFFGPSNELIRSIYRSYKPKLEDRKPSVRLERELQLLASCTYDTETEWGEEVGYLYCSVVEDFITSLVLHCKGWISVFIDPARPCFLGASTTNLNDVLVQQTRWSFGLIQVALSRFSPLIYCPLRMPSFLQSTYYAAISLYSCYAIPFYGLAIIPQICLLHSIPLYPKVSDPFFIAFAYIFIASQIKHVQEVFSYGDSFMDALYEMRGWMMQTATSQFYGVLNAVLHKFGLHEADFSLTNKAVDPEQSRRYEQGIYDFQTSHLLLVPLCSLYILNFASFVVGVARIFYNGDNQLLAQVAIPFFGIIVNFHLFQGMVLRKDNGCIPLSVSLLAVAVSAITFGGGSVLLRLIAGI